MDSRTSSDLPLISVRTPALRDPTGRGNRISSMPFTSCLCSPIIRCSMPRFVSGHGRKIPLGWTICSFVGNRYTGIRSPSQPRCSWSKRLPMTSGVLAGPVLPSCGMKSKSGRNLHNHTSPPGQYSIWSFARNPCIIFGRETRARGFGSRIQNRNSETRPFEIGDLPRQGISRPDAAPTERRKSLCIRTADPGAPAREPRHARRHERLWERPIRLLLQQSLQRAERCRNGGFYRSSQAPCVGLIVSEEIRRSSPTTGRILPPP